MKLMCNVLCKYVGNKKQLFYQGFAKLVLSPLHSPQKLQNVKQQNKSKIKKRQQEIMPKLKMSKKMFIPKSL